MLGFEEHVLVTLMEECAEIAQRASKALRFGLDEIQPVETGGDGVTPNRTRLTREVNDLLGVCQLLGIEYGDFAATEAKKAKVRYFAEYAREQGTLHGS